MDQSRENWILNVHVLCFDKEVQFVSKSCEKTPNNSCACRSSIDGFAEEGHLFLNRNVYDLDIVLYRRQMVSRHGIDSLWDYWFLQKERRYSQCTTHAFVIRGLYIKCLNMDFSVYGTTYSWHLQPSLNPLWNLFSTFLMMTMNSLLLIIQFWKKKH